MINTQTADLIFWISFVNANNKFIKQLQGPIRTVHLLRKISVNIKNTIGKIIIYIRN